jgi:inosose dehydratase
VIRVANAPVSYGAFELTVGVLPNVPDADRVLDAIAAAGYEGTELGPRGYLGEGDTLRRRLDERGLTLCGAFVELDFAGDDQATLAATLDVLDGHDATPVFADRGPRDGDVDLDGVQRAVDFARGRGYAPVFHHHMGTRVQTPAEIDRLLAGTDVGLLLDTGHLAAGGGDPVQALRDWRARIAYLHLKDVHLDALRRDGDTHGAFCELGTGDVDLTGFFAELDGYAGWLVVEQDWVPQPDEDPAPQIEAQARNRRWLRDHAGL